MFSNHNEYRNAISDKHREKPVVKYSAIEGVTELIVGGRVTMIPLDHPAEYLNGHVAHSSKVVKVEGKNFETLNTRYELMVK